MRHQADHPAAHRPEEGEHEEVEGGDLPAHRIGRDALDRRVLRDRAGEAEHAGEAEGDDRPPAHRHEQGSERADGRPAKADEGGADIGVLVALAEQFDEDAAEDEPGERADQRHEADRGTDLRRGPAE